MFRLQKCSRWIGQAQVGRFKLHYKIGETSNIHNRTHVLWTLTLAPILRKGKKLGGCQSETEFLQMASVQA